MPLASAAAAPGSLEIGAWARTAGGFGKIDGKRLVEQGVAVKRAGTKAERRMY
jgi:hypothetical protein